MNSKSSPSSSRQRNKRDDIQGLRAIAIIAVLIFHIWPDYFVRGFLGVDIFFVLSGYLMAMILSACGKINLSTTAEFYYRRLKRIVPIYLLVVCSVLVASIWIVRPPDYAQITHDALPAVGFVSNMADILEEADYFDAVTKFRYFLHSWSLAVEVQFYVLVPLLFWCLFAVPRHCVYVPCLMLAAASLALQATSSDKVAFGFLFCRIWQFMAGIVAFFVVDAMNTERYMPVPNAQDDTVESPSDPSTKAHSIEHRAAYAYSVGRILRHSMRGTLSFTSTFTLLAFLAVPMQVSDLICRVVVVVISGYLLVSGVWQQNILLDNRVSVWIGDASYTLYLVHWPIVVFFKYRSIEAHFSLFEGAEIVAISFCLAAVLHHYVDSHFRAISSKLQLFKVTLLLYLAVFTIYGSLVYLTPANTYKKADIKHFRDTIRDLSDPKMRNAALATIDLKTKIDLNALM
ncbi:Protein OAC-24, partial [Aphelenchoides avenae]